MIKITNNLILFLTLLILLGSCSEEKVKLENSGKTNFYENIDRFKNQYFNTEELDLKDNSGYNFPVVFLDIDEYILSSKDNKIIYIKGRKFNKEIVLNQNEFLSNKPTIINNNQIFLTFTDGSFKCFDMNFKLQWQGKINLSKFALINEPFIINDENSKENNKQSKIIISNTDGLIQCYNLDGKISWEKQFNSNIYKTLVTDNNLNIYIVQSKKTNLDKDTIFVLDKKGLILRNLSINDGDVIKNPVISNNNIYFMTKTNINNEEFSNLYSYDLKLNLTYKKEFNIMLRHLSINEQNQNVFVVTYKSGFSNISNGIFCLDKNGNENWHLYLEYSIPYPVLVSKDEICFTASNQKTIGIFYIDTQKGVLTNIISAGKLPDFNLEPSVNFDGSLMFSCSDSKSLIKIDETPLDKMLPY